MLDSLGLRLRQHCQYQIFVEKQFFEKKLMKAEEFSIDAES
jgi:hypothetical protein